MQLKQQMSVHLQKKPIVEESAENEEHAGEDPFAADMSSIMMRAD